MKIGNRAIGWDHPPFLIAEISCNHGGSLARALELIDAAKAHGADAVKFQAYTADTITIDSDRPEFVIKDGVWKGMRLHDLYKRSETPFEWFPAIKARAAKVGIAWLASVFDKTSIDMLVALDVPALKIASFEIIDLPLIRYAASTGRPLIISTGMANDEEIAEAWQAARAAPCAALLHCVSGYPSSPSEANLNRLQALAGLNVPVGISDHTTGFEIPIAAVALGAVIVEKHVRLSWHPNTEDTAFSLDEIDFAKTRFRIFNTWLAMHESHAASEDAQRPLRRSLFAVADIRDGEPFSAVNVRSIRPGHGLPPDAIDKVLGRRATRAIARGEPLQWDMVYATGVADTD